MASESGIVSVAPNKPALAIARFDVVKPGAGEPLLLPDLSGGDRFRMRLLPAARRTGAPEDLLELADDKRRQVYSGEREKLENHYIVMVEEPVDPSNPGGPSRLTAYPVHELYNFVRADTGAHLDADQQEEIQSRILELGEKQTAGSLLRAKLAAERAASEKERRSGGGVGMVRVSGEDSAVTMSGGAGGSTAAAAGSSAASARGGGRGGRGGGGGGAGDVDVGADSIDVLYGMIDGGAGGGGGGDGGGGGGGSGDVLGDALESAGWGSSAAGGVEATGTAAAGTREFDVFGRTGAGDEAGADFDQDFGDDAGDMGEAADDGIDEAARAGVEAEEVAAGEEAFDEDAFEEDDFDAAVAGAGDGEDGDEDGSGEVTTQQERERRMLERIAPGSTTGDAAAATAATAAAGGAAAAGAASKVGKIGGTATASGASVEEELFGPSSDEVTARAAKRARLETRYADPVTALRERVKRLLVAHGGRITVEVLNREFRKESHEKGQAFKDMLVSTLAALTYRTASAASGKHEFVQKGR